MKTIFFIIIALSFEVFASSKNTQLSKKVTSYAEGSSYSYIQKDVVDLCLVSKVQEVKDVYQGNIVSFCQIERNYGHSLKSDLYLESCDDILSQAKSCSPYL